MRYTKYKYKKNNEGSKLLISIILTMVIAIAIGNFGARWIIDIMPKDFIGKTDDIKDVTKNNQKEEEKEYKEVTYSVIQSGYFSKVENANHILTRLSSFENAFIFEDETGKFRVIADVVKIEDSEAILNLLKEIGIESAKIDYSMKEGKTSEGYIAEIVKGQFEIINAFGDETVKEIEILEFKEWVKSLELSEEAINQGGKIDSEDLENEGEISDKTIDASIILENYKAYIESLPDKVERKNVEEHIKNIYSVIINFKK